MDSTNSEYSEAGESGWTMYLDHSSCSKGRFDGYNGARKCNEEEEEGLSMVSDASSGPRFCYGEDEQCFDETGYACSLSFGNTSKRNKNKIKERYGGFYQQHSCLDDTASSPVQGFSESLSLGRNEALTQQVGDFSQDFPAAKLKGKSATRKTLGFLQPGKQTSEEKGAGKQRKKRG